MRHSLAKLLLVLPLLGATAIPATSAAPAGYSVGAWSPWVAKDGVQYRYRWGRDAALPASARRIDALFEIVSKQRTAWRGSARALTCKTGTLGDNKDVQLAPGQRLIVEFKVDNCGTIAAPFFKGSVVRSATY